MYPGSGPSDRNNDVLFPPIRDALVSRGFAVCAFDKRGVGESTGDWLRADIGCQADDLAGGLSAARRVVQDGPIGLFGHSQGAWVVIEASRRCQVDWLITNSGPAMTPMEQEVWSTQNRLREAALPEERILECMGEYARLLGLAASGRPWAVGQDRLDDPSKAGIISDLVDAGVFLPDSAQLWEFAASILGYDPRPALSALTVPLLAVLGGADRVVPVAASAESYRRWVRPDLLQLEILPDGDHRLQRPGTTEFVDGYPDIVTTFALGHRR